jgi:hypothetical protein
VSLSESSRRHTTFEHCEVVISLFTLRVPRRGCASANSNMVSLSALLVLCCSTVLYADPVGYAVYWAVPKVTVVSGGNRMIECPPYPKGYVLLGTFRKDAHIQHNQLEEDDKPACYHYEPLMLGDSS